MGVGVEEQVASWLKAQRVAVPALPVVADIVEITDAFCAKYLDAEYAGCAGLWRRSSPASALRRCSAGTAASEPPGSCTRSAG